MLCLAMAGAVTTLAATSFTLGWTHSVEHTQWQESWRVAGDRLVLVSASVEGSGAGIDLPDNAIWTDGKWRFEPAIEPLKELNLAASGATGGGWSLCTPEQCMIVGEEPQQQIRLWAERGAAGACQRGG